MNLVDVLYQMLHDRDPQVVSNCISALSEILASEGGMVVNAKITHYLLSRSDYYMYMYVHCVCVNTISSFYKCKKTNRYCMCVIDITVHG